MLSPNTFFDSIKAIYDNYGIELNKYDIIPLSAAEPSREYIGPFDEFPVLREADYRQYIPEKYSEKTYDEDPELFSYIYSKEFVQILKNSEEAVPVSTAELRYLYSIIDYENFNNDSLSELRKFLESRSIKKLFTPSIFRHIRKNSFHSYENPAGNSICVLEIKDETSLFFDIMPETRENLILEENGIIKTYFHYDEREEDKIIPILFEFGTTTKVLEPSPLVSKIKYYLDRQKFLFSERHNKINHFNSNISR